LRRTTQRRPHSEHSENIRDASGRCHGKGDGGDGTDRGINEQQSPIESALTRRVDQAADRVDQRIKNDQDPGTAGHGRARVRHDHEGDSPGNRDETSGEEQVHGPCFAE
jgi:hypothetical protein